MAKTKPSKEPKPLPQEPTPVPTPDGPSPEKANAEADKLSKGKGKGGGRGRRSNADIAQEKDDAIKREAEQVQLKQTCEVLAGSIPPLLNTLCRQLEDTYKPALDALKGHGVDQTFLLNETEETSVKVTTEQILLRITPEWVAKYGVYAMVIIVFIQIGLPRWQLSGACNKIMKQMKEQKDAAPTDTPQ